MELRHLRYFAVLAEELHFGRAAERLHMAQPPLSQRIRDLERELGVRLFDRTRPRIQLTEAGALLLEHTRPVLAGVDTAREAMRRLRPGEAGMLRVGVPPDTRPPVLRTLTAGFARRVPDVLIDLHELTTDEQLVRLREGELDAGVVRHPSDTVGLESGPVLRRELGVVLPADHPSAHPADPPSAHPADHPSAPGGAPVRLRDLDGASLVIFPRVMAPRLYDHLLLVCRDAGFLPGAIRHARNPDFVHGLVLAGRGVHLNEAPTAPLPEGLVWRPLDNFSLAWLTSVVWVPTRHNEAIAAFADAVHESLTEAGHRPHDRPHDRP
ncbi:LysR substrate-binding domain-containing protein [Streptomyces luomodiensis]|uniref:LysR substrate-binding domain-containing protein n=1 Tax=Streptomyces luomodiensis TaxID=3026192 RepID=A0ABY9UV76_9ACTN|nr:LysR substrate-binding domain-containing protein [Streptomyces sp. SCA4-21]WNE96383.1 LysR substrate-binding domain-containing protein [Streptomyces sp. SCA4-21]